MNATFLFRDEQVLLKGEGDPEARAKGEVNEATAYFCKSKTAEGLSWKATDCKKMQTVFRSKLKWHILWCT